MSGAHAGRRHRHSSEEHEEEGNGERWLLTYADMITLLLALFIVLFAISTINQKKFLALALGLRESFNPNAGVLSNGNGLLENASLAPTAGANLAPSMTNLHFNSQTSPPTTTTTLPTAALASGGQLSPAAAAALDRVQAQINHALGLKGLGQMVTMTVTTRGLVVQVLADKVFFATGSATLGPIGDQVVDIIGSVLVHDPYGIDVEGYTDNQPVTGGPYGSNEELSAVRAVDVVLRLSSVDGINLSRMAASGFGDTHPEAPNNSPSNMALNRRIDVVVLAPQEAQP